VIESLSHNVTEVDTANGDNETPQQIAIEVSESSKKKGR
jgi:hypothetical protein